MINDEIKSYKTNDVYELLDQLEDSQTRLKAIQGYSNELQALCYQDSQNVIIKKLQEYAPIMKLLNNDIAETLETTIKVLDTQEQ